MIRNIKFFTISFMIVLLLIIFIIYQKPIFSLLAPEKTKKSVISILKSENVGFLVTNKISTQILVEREELSVFGVRTGILIGNVTLYYGIDLKELTSDSIIITKNEIIVKLPQPKPLDFSIDLSSLRYIEKETGLLKIKGLFVNDEKIRKEIEDMFYKEALFFMKTKGLLPNAEDVLRSFNWIGEIISLKTGIKTRFTFSDFKKPLH